MRLSLPATLAAMVSNNHHGKDEFRKAAFLYLGGCAGWKSFQRRSKIGHRLYHHGSVRWLGNKYGLPSPRYVLQDRIGFTICRSV